MFQRLSNLLFGEVEEVAAELKGPNPCVTEADEEGWMIVNLPESDCTMQAEEDESGALPPPPSSSSSSSSSNQTQSLVRTEVPPPRPSHAHAHKRCRRLRGRTSGAAAASESDLAAAPVTPPRRARPPATPSPTTPVSVSPGSGSECGGGSRRGCMDESWFVTPPPCFTAEGAAAEAGPLEDLLIEHPSMSVYVSSNALSSSSSLPPVVGSEEAAASLAGSVRVPEPAAPPAACATMPSRVTRGPAAQAGALAKVTQLARVQRSKARMERRHLGRNRMHRQNLTREKVAPTRHTRNSFLHQPSHRNLCH
ncbi:uncharacterized protein tp53inp2b isoform X2 [Nelusetta ayraudi]|uniref:uncharacterized protein tp53inp2b isoform X2 n=1 Tax=Nelusetta ayraudi TaxID=303726 RepID=UPI003F72A0FE